MGKILLSTSLGEIAVEHKVSAKASRLSLKIDRKGQVIAVSPRFVPGFLVKKFVEQQEAWIVEKLGSVRKQNAGKSDDVVTIFGKNYTKKIEYIPEAKLGILIAGSSLVINTPEAMNKMVSWSAKHTVQLERFLKNTATTYVATRTEQLAKKMNVTYGAITMREQSSRWGSCSSKGNLNFNWRLVHATTEIIDYVIIHELAHRVHMDHSRNFWALVAKYDLDHLTHRGWLKRNGHGLS